jgi:hypothetical protein
MTLTVGKTDQTRRYRTGGRIEPTMFPGGHIGFVEDRAASRLVAADVARPARPECAL